MDTLQNRNIAASFLLKFQGTIDELDALISKTSDPERIAEMNDLKDRILKTARDLKQEIEDFDMAGSAR